MVEDYIRPVDSHTSPFNEAMRYHLKHLSFLTPVHYVNGFVDLYEQLKRKIEIGLKMPEDQPIDAQERVGEVLSHMIIDLHTLWYYLHNANLLFDAPPYPELLGIVTAHINGKGNTLDIPGLGETK